MQPNSGLEVMALSVGIYSYNVSVCYQSVTQRLAFRNERPLDCLSTMSPWLSLKGPLKPPQTRCICSVNPDCHMTAITYISVEVSVQTLKSLVICVRLSSFRKTPSTRASSSSAPVRKRCMEEEMCNLCDTGGT